jgi:hypothetical protein
MLIYEKDNKLNINFENSVNESPDLQICKSGDKTEVLIDGQSGGGGSGGGIMQVIATSGTSDKTLGELLTAYDAGTTIIVSYVSDGVTCKGTVIGAEGVHIDSKGNYSGSVMVARGRVKDGVGNNPFLLAIDPTASEADALAAYPTLL